MQPDLFEKNFFGEGNTGLDAMIQNAKSGHRVTCDFAEALRECYVAEEAYAKSLAKIAKQVSSNATLSSFKLYWILVTDLFDQIFKLHSHFSREKQALTKHVQLHIEEQQKSRKAIIESESSTQDVTHSFKTTTAQLHKAKEIYHARYAERQRMLRSDTATTRDQEKSEAKLKKAQDEYKYVIEKYNNLRNQFITKMHSSTRHFQEFEQARLDRMHAFVESFVKHWSNMSTSFAKLYTRVCYSLSQVTTERSLMLLVDRIGTGVQEPQCAFFEDAEVTAAFSLSAANGEDTTDKTVKTAADPESCSYCDEQSIDDRSSTSDAVTVPTDSASTVSDVKRSVGNKLSDRLFTRIRRNSPLVESSQPAAVTANGLSPCAANSTSRLDSPAREGDTGQPGEDEAGGRDVGDQQLSGSLTLLNVAAAAGRAARRLGGRHSASKVDVKDGGAGQTPTDDWRVTVANDLPIDEEGYSIPPTDSRSENTLNGGASSSDSSGSHSDEEIDVIGRSFKGIKVKIRPVGEFAPGVVKSSEVPQTFLLQQPISTKSTGRRRPLKHTMSQPLSTILEPEKGKRQESAPTPSLLPCVPLPISPPQAINSARRQPLKPCTTDKHLTKETETKSADSPMQTDAETSTPNSLDSSCIAVPAPEGNSNTHSTRRCCWSAVPLGTVEVDMPVGKLTESRSMDGTVELSGQPIIIPVEPMEYPKTSHDSLEKKYTVCPPKLPARISQEIDFKDQSNLVPDPKKIPRPQQEKPLVAQEQQEQPQPALSLLQPTVLHESHPSPQTQPPVVLTSISVAAAFTETWSVLFHNGGGSSFSTVALNTPPPSQSVSGELTLAFPWTAFDQLQFHFSQTQAVQPSSYRPLVLNITGALRIRNPKLQVPSASLTGYCSDGRSILLSQPTGESEACLTPPPCTGYMITLPSLVLMQLLSKARQECDPPIPDGLSSPTPSLARPSYLKVNLLTYTVAVENDPAPVVEPAGIEPLTPPIQLCTYWRCETESTDFRLDYTTHWPNKSTSRNPATGYLSISLEVDGGVFRMQSLPEGIWSPQTNQAMWKIPLSPVSAQADMPNSKSDGPVWKPNGDSSGTIRAKFMLSQGHGCPQPVVLKSYRENTLASGLQLSLPATTDNTSLSYVLSLCKNRIICDRYVCQPPGQFQ